MKRNLILAGLWLASVGSFYCNTASASLSGTYTINPSSAASASNYLTITSALSDMISGSRADGGTPNGSGVSGAVIFEFSGSYTSGSETFPLTFGAVSGASGTNTITFRPAAAVGSQLTITSNNATATCNFDGGDYYIFDGRPGGAGSNKYLKIANTNASCALRFINDATNNITRYCELTSETTTATVGIINFSTTSGSTGNDDNTIDNCNIHPASGTTVTAIYGGGTSGKTNGGNIISNSNFYDFFNGTGNSYGLNISSNNDGWTITGNSFYQTATRINTSPGSHYAMFINPAATGGGFIVSNNYIGGSTANAGGGAWTMGSTSYNTPVYGIYINASGGSTNSVQGNTIANMAISTANGSMSGIYINNGSTDIGTTSGNTIGDNSTGSITITTSYSGLVNYMIYATPPSASTVNIYNNTIGSITAIGTSANVSAGVTGIYVTGSTGIFTVSGNTIGNASTANSINASTASISAGKQKVIGIHGQLSSNPNGFRVINNTIANLNNNCTPDGGSTPNQTWGIFAYQVLDTITGNTIRNLSSGADVYGIYGNHTVANAYVANNTIHSLSSTYTGTTTVIAAGISSGPQSSITYYGNLVHSITAAGTGTVNIYGLHSLTGSTNTIANNMIRVGIDAAGSSVTSGYTIYGIYEQTGPGNYYHNSVYVGGTGVAGSGSTAAYYTAVGAVTREILNNIFVNNRSNGAGSGSHYAFRFGSTLGTLTMNNNIFYASGTGGIMGRQSSTDYSTLSSWQSASSQDANSINEDPLYNNATGNASAVNLHLLSNSPAESAGTTVASVTLDYDGQTRSGLTPIDIGADAGDFANSWTGSWSNGTPTQNDDVLISATSAPTTFSCKNLRITSGNSLNTGTNDVVTVYGNFTNNGDGVTGTGTITFAKTGNAGIFGDTLAHEGTITVSTGCTLETNNKLRLTSNATNTGRIGQSAGTISGNVYVQRYMPGKRCFRFYGHPFSSSIALSQLTDEIDITGSGGSSNGFTTTNTNNPSAFWFDVTAADTSTSGANPGWTAFTSANTASWDRYELLRLLVRGAKGEGLSGGSYTPSAATFEGVGTVNQGQQVVTLTKGSNSDFVACGNPYPSPIQMNTVTLGSNIGANYYAWDATSGASGAYVTNAWTLDWKLPAYAAFFTTTSATDNITFEETDKEATGTGLFKTTGPNDWIELYIYDSTIKWDRLLIHLDDNAMAVEDKMDGKKLYNPNLDFFTLSQDDVRLAVDVRPYKDSTSIPLGLTAYNRYNKYVIKAGMFNIPAGTKLYLHDKYLNKKEEIKQGFEYWFDVTADSNTQGNNRFEINMVGKPTGLIEANKTSPAMQLIPNPARHEVKVSFKALEGRATLTLTGISGQLMYYNDVQPGAGSLIVPLEHIPNGMYIVELKSENASFVEKLIKQ